MLRTSQPVRRPRLAIAIAAAAACGLALVAPTDRGARADEGTPPSPAPAPAADPGPAARPAKDLAERLAATVDAAFVPIGKAIPRGRSFRVAVLPIPGPGEAETGPGRYVAARATAWLSARGCEVVDRSFLETLREADAKCPGGPTGWTPERLAAVYLRLDAVLTGSVHDLGEEVEIALSLASADSGRVLETSAARVARDAAVRALLKDEARTPAVVKDVGRPGLSVSWRVWVQRRLEGGGFAEPEEWNGKPLRTGDRVRLFAQPHAACHLTILSFQASGRPIRFFPAEGPAEAFVSAARVAAEEAITVPGGGPDLWLPLVEPKGTETIFIIAEAEAERQARLEAAARQLGRIEAELRTLEAEIARLEDRKAVADAERRRRAAWEEERLRASELRADLEAGVREVALEHTLRQAFASIQQGETLAEVQERDFGAPIAGPAIPVPWEGGTVKLGTARVEAEGRVYIFFAIEHR